MIGKTVSSDQVKVIGGTGYDLRQPIPVKYHAARERFKNARNSYWTPEETPMGEDKLQWNSDKLTEAEKWLFKTNISYLTASDNLVPDNLNIAIMEHITANEVIQYLRWQVAEEANHIETYLFILESFGMDDKGQGQIFSLYENIPELRNKLNWNIDFTNNVILCDYPKSTPEANKAVLEDLISYYLFEFLFFPCGFSQIFALARQGKLLNTAKQYSFIWRDETLHAINGLWLIKQIIKENPELWNQKLRKKVRDMIDQAVFHEICHAKIAMPDGGIPGLNLETYKEYVRFLADRAALNLDIPQLFRVKSHPMPWISEYELNQEVNFFEGTVSDYQKGNSNILKWD